MSRGAAKRVAAGHLPKPSPHQLKLNVAAFDAVLAADGHNTLAAIAEALKVGTGTVCRARTNSPLSGEFVAALLAYLGDLERRSKARVPALHELVTPQRLPVAA